MGKSKLLRFYGPPCTTARTLYSQLCNEAKANRKPQQVVQYRPVSVLDATYDKLNCHNKETDADFHPIFEL